MEARKNNTRLNKKGKSWEKGFILRGQKAGFVHSLL
jgi:hypothetical protein